MQSKYMNQQRSLFLSKIIRMVGLGKWFSTEDDFFLPPRGHLAMSGDTFGCHTEEEVLLSV